jgi:hypothetical protein
MLSFIRWELDWIAPQYRLQDLSIDRSADEPAFTIAALNNEYVYVDGQMLPPGSFTVAGRIAVMPGLQTVILVLLVPLAWPGLRWKRRVIAVVFAIPLLLAVQMADIPVDLLGGMDLVNATYNHVPNTFAMTWADILDTGGRLALALAAGLFACTISSFIDSTRYLHGTQLAEKRLAKARRSR